MKNNTHLNKKYLFIYCTIYSQNPQLIQILSFVIQRTHQAYNAFAIDGRYAENVVIAIQFLKVIYHLTMSTQIGVGSFHRC